jgi:PAS fold
VVRILLTSRYQMWMGWGDTLSFFYNDAYRPTLGVKHAWALGASAREVWKEIWPDIGPRIEHVLKTGEATWDEGLLLFLERSGYSEETYHTFSYSPLSDDRGSIVGMLCVVTEETERTIGERRLSSLRELASEIAGKNTSAEVLAAAERSLSANLKDLPFTLIYQFESDGAARLACATGVEPGHPIAPALITATDSGMPWPVGELLIEPSIRTIDDLEQRFDRLPVGAWQRAPRQAVVATMARQGQHRPAGFLVAGINPFRRLDGAYLISRCARCVMNRARLSPSCRKLWRLLSDGPPRKLSGTRKRWKRSANSPAASPMTSTICSRSSAHHRIFLGGVIFRRSAGGDMLMRFLIRPTAPPS